MRLNRRYFCAAGAALIGSSCTAGNTPPAASESFAVRLDVFNDRFYELIGRETKADILAEGFQWSEGPCWDLDKKKLYFTDCLLYTSPSPRDGLLSRMPSSA